ncbi:hypothetical protein OHA72_46215 [Dactylosporangium sp. NBC_01737]|uniref:hypothetical protein n=1 Tax=Dactylosporangium sp. NBC_01737 TaxID=2975959 RepID=UPI002E0F7D05|nr:hypothetical protein OHA72_46215 [Dactylosporangium sp. NBC_01737]
MKRTITLGVLIAALAAASGACDRGSDRTPHADPPPSSALPSAAASEQLAAAVAKLDGQSLKYTITGNQGTLSGGFDTTTRGITLSGGTTTKLDYVILGDDVYLKGFDPQGRWWHLSVSRFSSGSTFRLLADPLFGIKFLTTARNVKQDAPGTFTGTLDVTKVAAGGVTNEIADLFAKGDPAGATAVPFTATVDSQGRLAGVKATFTGVSKSGRVPYELKIVEYGATAPAVRPSPAETIEAPPEAYNS